MKKILYWFGGIAIVLATGAFAAVQLIDAAFIGEKISAAVKDATGTPLEFSSAPSVTLLPPGLAFDEVRWEAVTDGKGARFVAKGGSARVALAPLLHGSLVIAEVTLDTPAVDAFLPESQAVPETDAHSSASGETTELPTSLPFALEKLTVNRGSLSCTLGAQRYRIKDFNLSVLNLRSDEDADLSCAFSYALSLMDEEMSGDLALSAKANLFTASPSVREVSLKLTPRGSTLPAVLGPLQLSGGANFDPQTQLLSLKDLSMTLPTASTDFSGTINLKDLSAQGAFRLNAAPRALAALFGITLPARDPDRFVLKGNIAASKRSLALSGMAGTLDDTPLKSDLSLAFGDVPSVKGTLSVGDADLDALLPQPSAQKKSAQKKSAQEKSAQKKPRTENSEQQKAAAQQDRLLPVLDLGMDMASLHWHGLKARDIQLVLRGAQGKYTLEKFAVSLESGGTLTSSGRADLNSGDSSLVLSAKDFRIGPIMEALGKGRDVEGTAHAEASLTASGKSVEALMASLSGSGKLSAGDLNVRALTETLQSVPVFKNIASSAFAQVNAPFTASKGILTFSPVTATSEAFKARATATVNLPRQYLQGAVTVSALGMDVPVNIEGPLVNLSYSLDPRFTVNVLKGVGEAVLNGGKDAGSLAVDTGKDTEKAVKDVGRALKSLFRR